MKQRGISILFAFLLLNFSGLLAQSYSHIIDQELSESDLAYMSAEELKVLKNEIIALKGAQSSARGNSGAAPFAQHTSSASFLGTKDQRNIELIERIQREGNQKNCSLQEQYELFIQLAKGKQQMPLSLAKQFYGISLNNEMSKNQKVIRLSDKIMAFWVPQFSTCKECPYTNHFVTINQSGEVLSNLKVEGVLSIKENHLLEIKGPTTPQSTTIQPRYYQIMANGKIVSKEI